MSDKFSLLLEIAAGLLVWLAILWLSAFVVRLGWKAGGLGETHKISINWARPLKITTEKE